MINNTTEDDVSFEVAKLLKDKGFTVPTYNYFRITGGSVFRCGKPINHNDDKKWETAGGMIYVSCPTIQMAIKWIRENFGFHIYTDYDGKGNWFFVVSFMNGNNRHVIGEYASEDFASNASIMYVLNQLVK